MWDLIILFFHKIRKVWPPQIWLILGFFQKFKKEKKDNILYKQIIVIYKVDIFPQ